MDKRLIKTNEINRAFRLHQRFLGGLCSRCNNERELGKQRCRTCLDNVNENSRNKRKERRSSNKCVKCNGEREINVFCSTCWFKTIAYFTSKDISGADIKEKLEAQNYKCYYIGNKLTPGVNATIDHKTPKSRGGESKLYNLVWCDKLINSYKGTMTDIEFMQSKYIVDKQYITTFDQVNSRKRQQLILDFKNLITVENIPFDATLMEAIEILEQQEAIEEIDYG